MLRALFSCHFFYIRIRCWELDEPKYDERRWKVAAILIPDTSSGDFYKYTKLPLQMFSSLLVALA